MSSPKHNHLIRELTGSQNRLYGFLLTLIPNREAARDVLQETNLVIWRKADEFVPGTCFWAWAAKIAYYQALAHHRNSGRDRHQFDERVLSNLHDAALEYGDEARRDALAECLGQLHERQRTLIADRYRQEKSLATIASDSGKSIAAVKMALSRIRRVLLTCIQRKTSAEVSA